MIVEASSEAAVAAVDNERPRRGGRLGVLVTVMAVVASLLAGLAVGPVHVGLGAIGESFLAQLPWLHVHSHLSSADSAILWQLRAPRVVLALLVGGMLAIAGASYQGVFRNPLADPYLLGIAAGAGLGA